MLAAKPGLIVSVIACAWTALQPSAALAHDEDVQLWVYGVASSDLGGDWRLTFDATARWREQRRGDEQQTYRMTVTVPIAEGVRLGGGAGVFETEGGSTEIRPHQQISWRSGGFSTRTRIEQRFFEGADRLEFRFRQLVRYAQPLGDNASLSVDGEYLGLIQTRNANANIPRDQWRARMILSSDVSDSLTLGAGYLMIFTPQEGRRDQINHVPQLYVTRRF